jgi:hypothetical protein
VKLVQRIVAHQQRVEALTQHGGEGVIEVGAAVYLDADQRHAAATLSTRMTFSSCCHRADRATSRLTERSRSRAPVEDFRN